MSFSCHVLMFAQLALKYGRKDTPWRVGSLEQHPEWWGSFIDDGPQQPNEIAVQRTLRIRKARRNMELATRETRPGLPKQQPGQSKLDYNKLKLRFTKDLDARVDLHRKKLDPSTEEYRADGGEYAENWKRDKANRKQENTSKRRQEYDFVCGEYKKRNLDPPPR